jgi:hypothetical protein
LTEAVQAKAVVRDDGGTRLGEVVEVVASPTLKESLTLEGELVASESSVFSDVAIVLRGEGTIASSVVRIGAVPMRVGKKVVLVGTGFEVQTVIMKVDWGQEAVQ